MHYMNQKSTHSKENNISIHKISEDTRPLALPSLDKKNYISINLKQWDLPFLLSGHIFPAKSDTIKAVFKTNFHITEASRYKWIQKLHHRLKWFRGPQILCPKMNSNYLRLIQRVLSYRKYRCFMLKGMPFNHNTNTSAKNLNKKFVKLFQGYSDYQAIYKRLITYTRFRNCKHATQRELNDTHTINIEFKQPRNLYSNSKPCNSSSCNSNLSENTHMYSKLPHSPIKSLIYISEMSVYSEIHKFSTKSLIYASDMPVYSKPSNSSTTNFTLPTVYSGNPSQKNINRIKNKNTRLPFIPNVLSLYCLIIILIRSINARVFGVYNETRWDPLVYNEEIVPAERLDLIRSSSGHFDSHYVTKPDELQQFGDLSIFTMNMYREVSFDLENIESSDNIRTILDETHASIICLQGVDDSLLKRIKGRIDKNEHYLMTNIDKYDVDLTSGKRIYLPIIYDSRILFMKMQGYFETEGEPKQIYGSYALFRDVRVQDTEDMTFTIINIDMFSSFQDVVSAQFSNLAQDVTSYERVANAPVVVAGTIGTVPPNISDLIKSEYINLLTKDANNEDLPLTTLHANGQDDGIQRDFILLRDLKKAFVTNYARILREFLAGDHYPLHAILSYSDEKFGMRERKIRDAARDSYDNEDDYKHKENKEEEKEAKEKERELNEPLSDRKRARNTDEEKERRNREFKRNSISEEISNKIDAEQRRKLEDKERSEPISK